MCSAWKPPSPQHRPEDRHNCRWPSRGGAQKPIIRQQPGQSSQSLSGPALIPCQQRGHQGNKTTSGAKGSGSSSCDQMTQTQTKEAPGGAEAQEQTSRERGTSSWRDMQDRGVGPSR